MKHSRHPFAWRADIARAAVLVTVVVVGNPTIATANKSTSEPAIEAPTVSTVSIPMPMVTPSFDFASPVMPTIAMPTVETPVTAAGPVSPTISNTRRAYELTVAEYRQNPAARSSHPQRIEYVDALIHLERHDAAIRELEAIEDRFPGAYVNAHLLGIAWERSGNLPTARRWFETAVERDPEAQEGTGWLRVAMIDAHLKLKEDPHWLKKNSVLDGFTGYSETQLIHAVKVQVTQRREVFAAQDDVLADLYFQIGVRMIEAEDRTEYFARSIAAGPLRKQDIAGQQVIHAQGPKTTTTR